MALLNGDKVMRWVGGEAGVVIRSLSARPRESGTPKRVKGKPEPGSPRGMSGKRWLLPPLHLFHFITLRAARSDDFHGRALGLADQRTRERRGDRDAAGLGVCLRLADLRSAK